MNALPWVPVPTFTGILDICIVTTIIYGILVLLKHTRRSAAVLYGVLIVATLYLLAYQFDLSLTRTILQYLFAAIAFLVIILFQGELRFIFERVGRWTLERGRRTRPQVASGLEESVLVPVLMELARDRVGALVVLRGRDVLDAHLDGGEILGGVLTAPILASIFDPHSIGHDGAVIIDDGRIARFGCHLPLSTNARLLKGKGTRHAAAVGLSERTDALCLIVSEERGTISIAQEGELQVVKEVVELQDAIIRFREGTAPGGKSPRGLFRKNVREKIVAPVLAFALWFVLVFEQRVVQRFYLAAVDFQNLPAELMVEDPGQVRVRVTLSGPKRAFYFMGPDRVRVIPRFRELSPGEATIQIEPVDFNYPTGLTVVSFQKFLPLKVRARKETTPP